MLDHVVISVSNLDRLIAFYTVALALLGISERFHYDGKDGPMGHPDLKGSGSNGRRRGFGRAPVRHQNISLYSL